MLLKVFLCYVTIASLFAFVLYAVDKVKAIRGSWRISEKALLLTGFFGGAIGALASMQIFRHKTKHGYFYFVNILGAAWQITVAVLLFTKGL